MGTKRVGLARVEALIENLKRDLNHKASTSNLWRFISGDYSGLSLLTKTDANCDTGFTFTVNTLHECAALGDAGNALALPDATAGALVVMKMTAQNAGGSNLVVTTNSGDFFAAQTLNLPTLGAGAGAVGPRVFGTDFTTTQTLGKIATIAATHNTLTISMTATNNQSNVGAELAFYCATDGFWRICWQGVALGTGVANATFAGSAV